MVHRLGDVGDQSRGRFRIALVRAQAVGQAAARDQFHAEVALALVLADLVHGHDTRMVEQGHRLRLVLEPSQLGIVGQDAGLDHLQSDRPIETDLLGTVDDAHPASAELRADLIVAEVTDAGPSCRLRSIGSLW